MRSRIYFIGLLSSIALGILSSSPKSYAQDLAGRVVQVIDGDTLVLRDRKNQDHQIHLLGIDAPEESQPYFQASLRNLSDMIFEQFVVVKSLNASSGIIFIKDQDMNLRQVEHGYAWVDGEVPSEKQIEYANAQKKAKEKSLGLWRDSTAYAPWKKRKMNRFSPQ